MANKEKRAVHRVPFISSIKLDIDRQTINSLLLNISLMGALIDIENTDRIFLNKTCEIELNLGAGILLNLTGCVVRHNKRNHTIGVMWEQMDIDTAVHLKRLLELNLGDHQLIEQDIEAMYEAHEKTQKN